MSRLSSAPAWLKAIALLMLVLLVPLAASAAPARNPAGSTILYLPAILRPGGSMITGRVTDNGTPAAGVEVELRFFNNLDWSSAGSATTGGDGVFRFDNPAALKSGEKYYVRYLNPSDSDDSRLAAWFTRELTSYSPGTGVNIGDFDLANVALTAPDHLSTISLPHTFEWAVRPASPQDSYALTLFDDEDGNPWFASGPLGHQGNYTLNARPSGFNANAVYAWSVTVFASDEATGEGDGYGLPFWYNYVTFASGQASTGSAPVAQSAAGLERGTPSSLNVIGQP